MTVQPFREPVRVSSEGPFLEIIALYLTLPDAYSEKQRICDDQVWCML